MTCFRLVEQNKRDEDSFEEKRLFLLSLLCVLCVRFANKRRVSYGMEAGAGMTHERRCDRRPRDGEPSIWMWVGSAGTGDIAERRIRAVRLKCSTERKNDRRTTTFFKSVNYSLNNSVLWFLHLRAWYFFAANESHSLLYHELTLQPFVSSVHLMVHERITCNANNHSSLTHSFAKTITDRRCVHLLISVSNRKNKSPSLKSLAEGTCKTSLHWLKRQILQFWCNEKSLKI